ncbi:hypothetical protein HK405_006203, partial [Cladochytrium tenue]
MQPMVPTTGGAQVAVGAGWNITTPPPTPSSPPPMANPSSPTSYSAHRTSWQNLPTSPSSPIPNAFGWSPAGVRPGSTTTGWHSGSSPTPESTVASTIASILGDRRAASPVANPTPAVNPGGLPAAPNGGSNAGTGGTDLFRRASSINLSTAEAAAVGLDPRNLYVKNLDDSVDHQDLFGLFKAYGRIVSARVMKEDGGSGKSKGFGFVSFEEETQARTAMESLDGFRWGSKSLVVCVAEPKSFRERKLQALHGT